MASTEADKRDIGIARGELTPCDCRSWVERRAVVGMRLPAMYVMPLKPATFNPSSSMRTAWAWPAHIIEMPSNACPHPGAAMMVADRVAVDGMAHQVRILFLMAILAKAKDWGGLVSVNPELHGSLNRWRRPEPTAILPFSDPWVSELQLPHPQCSHP
jgi:hypothetical protein